MKMPAIHVAALADTRRRRDFKTAPMILDKPDLWDEAALAAVLAYNGGPKLGQYRLGRSVAQRHAQFVELANLLVQRAQLPVRVRDVWFGSSYPLRSGYVGQVSISQNWPAVILAAIHLSRSHPRPRMIPPPSNLSKVRSQRRTTVSWFCSGAARCSWPVTMRSGSMRSGC